MKPVLLIAGLFLFCTGLVVGYWFADADRRPLRAAGGGSDPVGGDGGDRRRGGVAGRRSGTPGPLGGDRSAGRDPSGRPDIEEGDRWKPRPAAEALKDLQDALASGDREAAHEALHHLSRPEAGSLSSEQLRELGSLLRGTDRDYIHGISRALVISGGKEGLAMVMDFVDDPEQPLEVRRHALDGLSDLPRQKVAEVFPALAGFLESRPPHELEHAAAHAMARMQGEQGVDALLGLLQERPGIRPEVIFDTVGDVGKSGDMDALLGFLAEGGNQSETASILRAASRISAREGDTQMLLDMLRETPDGISREMIARAISESSHELGTGFLSEALREVAGDRRAQECLADALSRTGGREALEALVEAARGPEGGLDPGVLARALQHFRGSDAVPFMMDLFQASGDEEMLHSLARGILRNGDAGTTSDLLALLGEGDARRRRAIADALEEGSSSVLSQDLLLSMIRGEKDHEVAMALARSLSRLHPQALAEQAGALFDGASSAAERIAFAHILEKQQPAGAQERIARQLQRETDERAQWELARMLGRFGPSGVEQAAEILRGEQDEGKRHSMLWGLEAAGRHEGAPVRDLLLEVASTDPAPSLRFQAAEIMARQHDPSLIPDLEALLASETHPEVQERIRAAIHDLQHLQQR
ncbi:MAG: HEAT repeat domain-containing protein [Planctomycetes bacterium]|nr:HEAT repeat domain-containing protein [Planctomycetota bacterium]